MNEKKLEERIRYKQFTVKQLRPIILQVGKEGAGDYVHAFTRFIVDNFNCAQTDPYKFERYLNTYAQAMGLDKETRKIGSFGETFINIFKYMDWQDSLRL